MIRSAILGCFSFSLSLASSTISLIPSTERLSSGVSSLRPRSYRLVMYGSSPRAKIRFLGSTGKVRIGAKNDSCSGGGVDFL